MAYRTFEHTADMGLEVEADDLLTLFLEAARGFRELTVEAADLRAEDRWETVDVRAEDREGLLVAWLDELLFLWDARGEMLVEWADVAVEETRATARGRVARATADAAFDAVVKAFTYHELSVERRGGGWRARVVLDV